MSVGSQPKITRGWSDKRKIGSIVTVPALVAPVLLWDGDGGDATADFLATLHLPLVGDTATLTIYNDAGLTSVYTTAAKTLTLPDILGSSLSFAITDLVTGTKYARLVHARTGWTNGVSNTEVLVLVIGDVTAPTLSSPVDLVATSTTGTGSVSTNEGNGDLYWVLSSSATPPTAAQVRAGQMHTGAAAAKNGSQVVSGTGVQTITGGFTGLTASTTYYAHYMHEDTAGNRSAVSSGDGFTTSAASYSQTRVAFDGTNDYLSYTPNASFVQSEKVTCSWWMDLAGGDGASKNILSNGGRLTISKNSGNKIAWVFTNTASVSLWTASSDSTFLAAGGLTHFAIAFDGLTGAAQFYVNGAPAAFTSTIGPTTGATKLHWDRAVASFLFGSAALNASVGDFWLSNQYHDLSTEIGNFISGGNPVDLSGYGAPLIWFGDNHTAADWNAGTNLGSATATFTMNGAVT